MYTKVYKSDFDAKWISASNEFLSRFDREKTPEFPSAKFIWSWYTRIHFRRVFSLDEELSSAFLHPQKKREVRPVGRKDVYFFIFEKQL